MINNILHLTVNLFLHSKKHLVLTILVRYRCKGKLYSCSSRYRTVKYIKDGRNQTLCHCRSLCIKQSAKLRIIILINCRLILMCLGINGRCNIQTKISNIRNVIRRTKVNLCKRSVHLHLCIAVNYSIIIA